MRLSNHVESLAKATYSALENPKYLPDIKYIHQSYQDRKDGKEGIEKERRPFEDEIKCYHFPQTWGSTALGFGGMGGAAMTTAYTTVVILNSHAAVFFNGGWAYTVPTSKLFWEDLFHQRVVAVHHSNKYQEEE